MIKITELKCKVKIEFEYSTRLPLKFASVGADDLKKIIVNVFLKDGSRINHEDISNITMKIAESQN